MKVAAVGAAGTLSACSRTEEPHSGNATESPPLPMAGYGYDRVERLIDGRVRIEGRDVQFEVSNIGEMNTHAITGPRTREVTEIGLHPYMLAVANEGHREYVLLPIFPLRLFRHKSIFIRPDRGIEKPEDLRGKRIATSGYSTTSLTWIRGMLQHEYGITPRDVEWVITSKDSDTRGGKGSKLENILPDDVTVTPAPEGRDESELLVAGEVDAVFHALEPKAFTEGNPNCVRLFADTRETERAYFAKTGIFPIMHAIAIRRDVAQRDPSLLKAIFQAYSMAKQQCFDSLRKSAWVMISLPWIAQEIEATRALMGDNYWPYGIAPNLKTLEALCRYSHEQGLTQRKLTIEELFHPATLEFVEQPSAGPTA